jgi:predicted dehydrogenase
MDTIGPVRELIVRHPVRMVLGSWLSSTPSPPWWRRETESGGQIVEQTTHLFDLARSLLGEGTPLSAAATRHPRERYPDMDVSDVSIATLRFQNGALGQFAATCLLPTGGDVSLRLFGDEMLITITQERVEILDSEGTRTIERRNDPFLDEDRAFLRAAAERDPSLLYCDYEDALKTHRLCCALRRMSRHTEHAES